MKRVWEVFSSFFLLGCVSFGGPVAHIGYFQNTFVQRKQWLSQNAYSELVAICQFLPGPASSQVGFAIGYHRAGILGALCAFLAFTAPSVALLVMLSSAMPLLSEAWQAAIVHGLKIAACVVVADACLSMFLSICKGWLNKLLALVGGAAVMAFAFQGGHVLALMLCGILALLAKYSSKNADSPNITVDNRTHIGELRQPSSLLSKTCMIVFVICLVLSLFTVFVSDSRQSGVETSIIFFDFFQAGSLVFGGGHVVLPMLETVTVDKSLIDESAFLAGYGFAQVLPGPLFSFAAYLGVNMDASASPVVLLIVTLAAIFLPGFLLLLAVLPVWQHVMKYQTLRIAFQGISAGVVGLLTAVLISSLAIPTLTYWLDIIVFSFILGFHRFMGINPLAIVSACVFLSVLGGQLGIY